MMKHLKSMFAFAIVVGVCSAFTFKSEGSSKSRFASVVYVYNLGSSSGAKDVTNWTQLPGSGSGPACGTPGDVPCKVVIDSSVYPTLQSYFDAQHFASDNDVAYGEGVIRKQGN